MTSLFSHNQINIDDLKSNDTRVRLRAIKSLPTISSTIGKEKTRNELLPFLTSLIDDEEEENLIELTKIMSNFIENIGGKQYVLHIIKFFENLLQLDEFLLRYEVLFFVNKVVKGLKNIFSIVNPQELESSIIDIISKLLSVESINNKLSIIVLIPLILPYSSTNNKNNLTQLYYKLCTNDNFYVKKEASLNAKDLACVIDEEIYMKILSIFIKDSNDNIRVYTIDNLAVLKNHKTPLKFQEFIINCFTVIVNDESWRIRFTFVDKIHEFLGFLNLNSGTKATLIEVIAKYMEDNEAEVRNMCCQRLEFITEKLSKEETFDKILKKLKQYESEQFLFVKETFAKHVLRICPYLNKAKIQEYVIPPFLTLINEENHNIRLGILKNVDKLNEIITIDIFNQYILPAFLAISNNKNWRMRVQVTDSLPIIAKIVNREVFLKTLLNISLKWISDDVYAIREEGCKVLKKLYDYFKCEEFERRILEKLTELKNDVNYLRRNIVLILIREFITDNTHSEFFERSLLPFVISMSKDKVCNIRMSSVCILRKVQKSIKNNNSLIEIRNVIEELKKDNDNEISYCLVDDQ